MAKRNSARSHKVSPWVPNQHGAWSMLVGPALVASIALIVFAAVGHPSDAVLRLVCLVCIVVAWLTGYFTFFAFGLWVKARNPARRHAYGQPLKVYGPICAAACTFAVLFYPHLLFWALPFAPLIGLAVYETLKGRSRSVLSGFSTTFASSLIIPAILHIVTRPSARILAVTAFVGLYHFSTTMYVKSVVREKGNDRFWVASIAYHAACLVACVVGAVLWPAAYTILSPVVMAAALARAVVIPRKQRQGQKFTAKQIGMMEVPITVAAYALSLWALLSILL